MRIPIFTGKDTSNAKTRFQGSTTKIGAAKFEAARQRLGKLAGRTHVSDGDVMEFLARGEDATVAYLAQQKAAAQDLREHELMDE